MSKTESPLTRKPLPEPAFIIHVGRKTGWALLCGVAVLIALLVIDLGLRRRHDEDEKVHADAATHQPPVDNGPTAVARVSSQSEISGRSRPSDNDSAGEWRPVSDRGQAGRAQADDDLGAEPQPYHAPDNVEPQAPAVESQSPSAQAVDPVPADQGGSEPAPAIAPPDNAPDIQPATPTRNRNDSEGDARSETPTGKLLGAGATFPSLIYQKWFADFHRIHPEVEFSYSAIGSGGGIRQLQLGNVDFGATDGPMTDQQLHQARTRITHIPTVLDAVVPIYNVPGVGEIRFTAETLAGIFLGRIVSWSDPALAEANPNLHLPDLPIVVVHRSDASAVTYIFTDFLSKASDDWRNSATTGTAVSWPFGMGGKGSDGVAGIVQQTEGAIGYVELIYALGNRMQYGSVRNASGRFVKASLDTVTAAAASVRMPADFRVSITNAPGEDAYPISSFTWLLVPQSGNAVKRKELRAFLMWMIDQGQGCPPALSYAPLPKNVARQVKEQIARMP